MNDSTYMGSRGPALRLSTDSRDWEDHCLLRQYDDCDVCRRQRLDVARWGAAAGYRTRVALVAALLALSVAPVGVLAAQQDEHTDGVVPPGQVQPGDQSTTADVEPGLPEQDPIPSANATGGGAAPSATQGQATPVTAQPPAAASPPGASAPVPSAPTSSPGATTPPPAVPAPVESGPPEPAPAPPPLPPSLAADEAVRGPQDDVQEPADSDGRTRTAARERRSTKARRSKASVASAAGDKAVASAAPPAVQPIQAPPGPTDAGASGTAVRPGDRAHTVQTGESLWSIATALLRDGASAAQIAREVNRLWEMNEHRIGTGDPDLLMVGTRLRLR